MLGRKGELCFEVADHWQQPLRHRKIRELQREQLVEDGFDIAVDLDAKKLELQVNLLVHKPPQGLKLQNELGKLRLDQLLFFLREEDDLQDVPKEVLDHLHVVQPNAGIHIDPLFPNFLPL